MDASKKTSVVTRNIVFDFELFKGERRRIVSDANGVYVNRHLSDKPGL